MCLTLTLFSRHTPKPLSQSKQLWCSCAMGPPSSSHLSHTKYLILISVVDVCIVKNCQSLLTMPPSISEHSEACRLRQGIMGWEAPQLDGRDSNINPVRITPASTVCWPIKEQQWTTNISVRKGGKNWVVQETLIRATPMHLTMRLECTSNSKILRGSAITMAGVTNKFKKNDRLFLPTRQDVCQKQYTQC